jgi:predicted RecA/RadA family phage recombinase
LFLELLSIVRRRFFKDGKPIESTMAISSGDFKLCGIVIGMSIMQGGPAANFMSHGVSCFFSGCKMLTSNIKNPAYKEIAALVSS